MAEEFCCSVSMIRPARKSSPVTRSSRRSAALLVELALKERIGVTAESDGWRQRGRLRITDTTPTDDPELDSALAKLQAAEGKKIKDHQQDVGQADHQGTGTPGCSSGWRPPVYCGWSAARFWASFPERCGRPAT